MNSLRLRFVRGMGWDSKVIERQTRGWTSHVELLVSPTCTFGAQLKGGVTYRSTNDACYRNVSKVQVWDVPVSNLEFEAAARFRRLTEGAPYDWRAIISFAFGERDWREPGAWFCSEWCAALLENLRLARFPDVSRITPMMLYEVVVNLPNVWWSA